MNAIRRSQRSVHAGPPSNCVAQTAPSVQARCTPWAFGWWTPQFPQQISTPPPLRQNPCLSIRSAPRIPHSLGEGSWFACCVVLVSQSYCTYEKNYCHSSQLTYLNYNPHSPSTLSLACASRLDHQHTFLREVFAIHIPQSRRQARLPRHIQSIADAALK